MDGRDYEPVVLNSRDYHESDGSSDAVAYAMFLVETYCFFSSVWGLGTIVNGLVRGSGEEISGGVAATLASLICYVA